MSLTQDAEDRADPAGGRAPMPRASQGPAEEAPRVPFLDGIRGLAILLVILHHGNFMEGLTPLDRFLMEFTQSTWLGVDLFFVLSGFLITGILIDAKGTRTFFRTFYLRRIVRIFPVYYLTIFFFFYIFQPFIVPDDPDVLDLKRHQLWYWTYLSNIYTALHGTWPRAFYLMHLWSVSIEEQFYIVWPFVVLMLGRKDLKFACLCCILGSFLLRVVLIASQAGAIPVYVSTAARLDGLTLGALIAVMIREPDDIPRLVRWSRATGLMGLAVVGAFIYFFNGMNMTRALDPALATGWFSRLNLTVGIFAVTLVFGWFLVAMLTSPPGSLPVRLLSGRVLRIFGKYSYCIYLWHLPFAHIMQFRLDMVPRRFPLVFGSQLFGQILCYAFLIAWSLGAAWLSWNLFEKHFLKLKRYFPYGTVVAPGKTPALEAVQTGRGGTLTASVTKS
jgi:peptidoglycan/LPS O-acetylase OafA/YrhL